jgi:hypothetical protein
VIEYIGGITSTLGIIGKELGLGIIKVHKTTYHNICVWPWFPCLEGDTSYGITLIIQYTQSYSVYRYPDLSDLSGTDLEANAGRQAPTVPYLQRAYSTPSLPIGLSIGSL